ncbi:LysR family transcriptional regulator [Vibrio sp. SCSIO 43137]|uniref:LysR family transcriptional regulator n=1 Tax=Vibrio sp. SCSIO 43137 TaxID=3021011 RepID=UPI002306E38D|nr:LysR family transcriptional regulator [Vibrio sp. SCSIO 43137]WCE31885.1 LysR family transcriptional regulator [Vibrio sp. SCSIO 43137]
MKDFDINLLRVMAVLLEERSVTAAAERLYLSQSAVSKQLAKLREVFDDPLFERMARGLNPTPKALSLAPRIYEVLNQVDQLAIPSTFEPENSKRLFNFDLVETAYPVTYPYFMPQLLKLAPCISITSRTWGEDSLGRLLRREIDFGIGIFEWDKRSGTHVTTIPDDLHYVELMRDNSVCLMRKGHPALQEEWNLDTFLKYRHLFVTVGGVSGWLLKEILASENRWMDNAVKMSDVQSAVKLCEASDLLMCYPRSSIKALNMDANLVVMPIPLQLDSGGYFLLWHRHYDNDPSHKWLRELIVEFTPDINSGD